MKILFVLPEYPPDYGGGIAAFYGTLLPALVRQGHSVSVMVGSAFVAGGSDYTLEGVEVTFLAPERFHVMLPRFVRYAAVPELQRHLAAAWSLWEQAEGGSGYDAVEVVDWGLLFVPWMLESEAPLRVQLHGSSGQIAAYDATPAEALQGEILRLLEAGLLPHARALATHSRANAAAWTAITGRAVEYAPPPLCPTPIPLNRDRDSSGFVAGRIQEWKGPQVLCQALRLLGSRAPVIEWAGRPAVHPDTAQPYDEYLAAMYPEIWGSRLRPLGQLPPQTIACKQASATFVVVPSLWDVYNLTAAEAMLSGAVVICSQGAGAVDLIEDGRNGFAVPPADPAALADALRRASSLTPAEREAIGRAARETALDQLDPRRVAAVHVEELARASSEGRPAPNEWLQRAVRPAPPVDKLAFLNKLPLRGLMRYVTQRAGRTIVERLHAVTSNG